MCTEYIQDFGHWWKRDVVATQLFPEDVKVEAVEGVTIAVPIAQEGVNVEDVVATQLSPEYVKVEAFKSVTVADQRAQEDVEDVVATQLSPEDVTVEAVKGVADQIAQEGVAVEGVVATQLSPEDVTVEAVKGVADQIAQEGVAVADQQQPTGVRDGAQETSLSTVADSAAVHVKPTRNAGYHRVRDKKFFVYFAKVKLLSFHVISMRHIVRRWRLLS